MSDGALHRLGDELAAIHDEIGELLRLEQHPDGTYETTAIEVEIADLERWKNAVGRASDAL